MKNKIILGTVQFGLNYGINNLLGKPSVDDVFQILKLAEDAGIEFLDTAAAYGNSEEIIGKYIKKEGKKPFKIITKFHLDLNTTIYDSINKSLDRLNIRKIHILLFHSYNEFIISSPYVLKEIEEIKYEGLIDFIGVSVYNNNEVEEILKYDAIDVIQLPFNLLDNYKIKGELLKRASKRGKTIHIRSIFLQGLFFKEPKELPENLSALKEPLVKIHMICKKTGLSINQLSLAYAQSINCVDGVLIGVDNMNQLKENVESCSIRLSSEIIEEIHSIIVENINLLNPSTW